MSSIVIILFTFTSLWASTAATLFNYGVDCEQIKYYLWISQTNEFCQINTKDNGESLKNCGYNKAVETYITADGYLQMGKDGIFAQSAIKGLILGKDPGKVNLIIIDCSPFSGNFIYVFSLQTSPIGFCVAINLYIYINKYGTEMSKNTCAGFSLGTSVIQKAQEVAIYRCGRCIYFEVPNPVFTALLAPVVTGDSAARVDLVRCSFLIGIKYCLGHATWDVNNPSVSQPNCNCLPEPNKTACDHVMCARALGRFFQSLVTAYKANSCATASYPNPNGQQTTFLNRYATGFFQVPLTETNGTLTTPCSPKPAN